MSEIIPVFSRKPIFGYPFMVFSGIAIGFMGWGVWAHHMFASGLGPISVAAFSVSTMFIAVPTGVKILNWMATMWGGKITFTTPMLFSIGLVAMFTIGGLSGVTHAVAPADTQQTDTYYIVAHFHYVIFGGALLGFVGGMYFWWPKVFGYFLNDKVGKVNFWLTLIGFNLTFGPMHILGLQGMSRRIPTYRDGYGFNLWNMVSTIGAFTLFLAFCVLGFNIVRSKRQAHLFPAAGAGPVGRPQPRVEHPVAHAGAQLRRRPDRHEARRLLAPQVPGGRERAAWSRWPRAPRSPCRATRRGPTCRRRRTGRSCSSAGLPVIGYGLIFNLALAAIGGAIVVAGFVGWALEPPTTRTSRRTADTTTTATTTTRRRWPSDG